MTRSYTRLASSLAAWGGIWLWLASCGPGDTQSAAPIPRAELPDQLAAAYCDGLGSCCQASGFALDDARCQATLKAQVAGNLPTTPTVGYDQNAAGNCVAALRTQLGRCGDIEDDQALEACNRMFVGTLPEGAACTQSEECAAPPDGRASCYRSADDGAGVCQVYRVMAHGAVGQACTTTCTVQGTGECYGSTTVTSGSGGAANATASVACYTNDGLYCASGTCQKMEPVGGPCQSYATTACVATAYCDTQAGLCQAKLAVGADCSSADSCVDGAYCATSGRCEAQKADNLPCQSYRECRGYCDLGESTSNGVCAGGDSSTFQVTARVCTETFGMEASSEVSPAPSGSGGSPSSGGTGGTGG